jgi:hypothetical protein
VRKISFLLALVLTLVVAGVAAAANAPITITELNTDSDATFLTHFSNFNNGDDVVISGAPGDALTKANFDRIRGVMSILLDASAGETYDVDFAGLLNTNAVLPAEAFKGDQFLGDVVAWGPIKEIGANAFTGAKKFHTLTIAGTALKKIAANAFQDSFVTTVVAFGPVEEIGDDAFNGSTRLSAVTNWGSVKKLGARAFKQTDFASGITLSAGTWTIGEDAFADSKLGAVTLTGVVFLDDKLPNGIFRNTKLTSVTLPVTLKVIGANAFAKTTTALTVNFSALTTLKTIEDGAFQGSGLVAAGFTVVPSLETIGKDAFNGCSAVTLVATSLNPAGVSLKTIGDRAFRGIATSGVALQLPATITEVGEEAFLGSGLTSLVVNKPASSPVPTTAKEFLDSLPKMGKDALRGTNITPGPTDITFSYVAPSATTRTLANLVSSFFDDNTADANTKALVNYMYNVGFSSRRVADLTWLTQSVVDEIVKALPTAGEDNDKEEEEEGKTDDDEEGKTGGSGGGGCATGAVLPFAAMLALGLVKRKSGR